MRRTVLTKRILAIIGLVGILLCLEPVPALADGGLVIPDPLVWGSLTENQQIAVIRLNEDQTVKVDLFISMQDKTGVSHEITYFLPLGNRPANFQGDERTSAEFDQSFTSQLDSLLNTKSSYKGDTQLALLSGPFLMNGGWLLPIAVPLMLTGCGSFAGPEAALSTPNSQINIYGLDADTSIAALADIEGLDQSVQDTLERFRGQKIAIIKIKTQPVSPTPASGSYRQDNTQPGLHFSWTSPLGRDADTGNLTFTYPLGTGTAWANPIPITRVYIMAPRSSNFQVKYPKLGEEFTADSVRSLVARTRDIQAYGKPAYSVEEYADSSDHAWRITYTHSNSSEDIVITFGNSSGLGGWIDTHFPLYIPVGYTVIISLVLSLLSWVAAWRYIVPRRLGVKYSWRSFRLWTDSLLYPMMNFGLMIGGIFVLSIALVIIIGLFSMIFHSDIVLMVIGVIAGLGCLALISWLPARLFVNKIRKDCPQQPRIRLWTTYIFMLIAANAGYFVIGLVYTALTGAL